MTGKPYSPAVEDYLEAILSLEGDNRSVRSIDLSRHLNVTRAAVSKALISLSAKGLIEHAHYSSVSLTEEGRRHAAKILYSHQMLKRFLVEIVGIEEAVAEADACLLEHSISDETRRKWLDYIKRELKDNE